MYVFFFLHNDTEKLYFLNQEIQKFMIQTPHTGAIYSNYLNDGAVYPKLEKNNKNSLRFRFV